MPDFPLRVDLPRGGHALVRDPEEVPERLRRPYLDAVEQATAAMLEAGLTQADLDAAKEDVPGSRQKVGLAAIRAGARRLQRVAADVLLAALVLEWSFGDTVSADAAQELPGAAYDALVEVCESLAPSLSPDFTPNPDPQSPTTPSSG
jgi:hypothetical protein